tara:strand:- start:1892 stop:2335 length:444 start_codon:yes stop_codon:yes gene_type:complete
MKKDDNYNKLSASLDTNFDVHMPMEIVKEKPMTSPGEGKIDKDYNEVRNNLYDLIQKGNIAIDGILQVADAGDSPRAYEVVSQLLKTVSDMNKDVLHVHKEMKTIKEENLKLSQKNTTNNTIYVGSTSELQDLINPDRSSSKTIKKV